MALGALVGPINHKAELGNQIGGSELGRVLKVEKRPGTKDCGGG